MKAIVPALATLLVAITLEAKGANEPTSAMLREQSRSRVAVRGFTVFLFAADERKSQGGLQGCFGGEGSGRVFEGDYSLFVVRAATIIGSLHLGRRSLVEGTRHDGLRTMKVPGVRRAVLALFQYESCASEALELVDVGSRGELMPIRFRDYEGGLRESWSTSHGAPLVDPAGRPIFCLWFGELAVCTAFGYDAGELMVVEQWAPTGKSRTRWALPTDADRARMALIRLLGMLADRRYEEAEGLLDRSPSTHTAADLARYCEACRDWHCPELDSIGSLRLDRKGSYVFQVAFRELEIDDHRWFPLRVAVRHKQVRVLDLPPCVPRLP